MYTFDNSNLNESYAGIISPMTFSFMNRVYKQVYIQFCKLFGVSDKTVTDNTDIFSNLLASVGGRAYYQLHNWHRMFLLFPGYSFNGKFLEDMMGIPKEYQGTILINTHTGSIRKILYFTYISIRMVFIFIFMGYLIEKFTKRFNRSYQLAVKQLQKPIITLTELKKSIGIYQHIETDLTRDFRVPIANDMAVMISSGIQKIAYQRWNKNTGDAAASVPTEGNLRLKSVEPGKHLSLLIRMIRENHSLTTYFLRHSPEKNVEVLQSKFTGSKIHRAFVDYLNNYGSRVPGELKLETVSFIENPTILMKLIQNNLQTSASELVTGSKRTRLTYPKIPLTFWQSLTLSIIDKWVNTSIMRRELTRFYRTKIFGLMRQYLNGVGKALYRLKYIRAPEDIFYLTIEDLERMPAKSVMKTIIQHNKQNKGYFQTLHMPRRITSENMPVDLARFRSSMGTNKNTKLHGTIASRGNVISTISGEAIVLTSFDPTQRYTGKILVTPQTDPGWTIVFPMLRGLVVERGGMLSHAAIISREFGIPCIMSVAHATDSIKSGQTITIDMNTSTVRIT